MGEEPLLRLVTRTHYDSQFGRVKQLEYPDSALDGAQVSLYQVYNAMGALVREGFVADYLEATPELSDALRVVSSWDGRGRVIGEQLGVSGSLPDWRSTQRYDSSGWLLAQCVNVDGLCSESTPGAPRDQPQDLRYRFDVYGNLVTQWHNGLWLSGGAAQSGLQGEQRYRYDALMRLTQSTRRGADGVPVTVDYGYDAIGGLLYKSDYSWVDAQAPQAGQYQYQAGSHRLHSVQLPRNKPSVQLLASYEHDANGNLTERNEAGVITQIDYDIDNLPRRISRGAVNSAFFEGPGGRWLQRLNTGLSTRDTWSLEKTYEREVVNGQVTVERYYMGGQLLTIQPGAGGSGLTRKLNYLHADRLGSPVSITSKALPADGTLGNAAPVLVEHRGFDAFGKALDGRWGTGNGGMLNLGLGELFNQGQRTQRGYTGHEHLDEYALIHMNGRAYDYNLGRFLGVDPIIQFPANSQSLNPYSYLMNNPLSGTDPTGYAKRCDDMPSPGESCDVIRDIPGSRIKERITITRESESKATATNGAGTTVTIIIYDGTSGASNASIGSPADRQNQQSRPALIQPQASSGSSSGRRSLPGARKTGYGFEAAKVRIKGSVAFVGVDGYVVPEIRKSQFLDGTAAYYGSYGIELNLFESESVVNADLVILYSPRPGIASVHPKFDSSRPRSREEVLAEHAVSRFLV